MRIALDAMGGDFSPDITLKGAEMALSELKEIYKLYLVGPQSLLEEKIKATSLANDSRIAIVHAPDVISMEDSPTQALRTKKTSSINLAVELVQKNKADAIVSAGNTGAMVAITTLGLKLLDQVKRPAIISPFPTKNGACYLIDAGANPAAKPEHLLTNAIMGSIYCQSITKNNKPKLGLLSNGSEYGKGTKLVKEAFELISEFVKKETAPFEFLGNIESYDLFSAKVDVVVCDGFTGNIVLKTAEATASILFENIKEALMKKWIYHLGTFLCRPAFKAVKKRLSYESYGGNILLGASNIAIIAHGSSSPIAIKNAIRTACDAIRNPIIPSIQKTLKTPSTV